MACLASKHAVLALGGNLGHVPATLSSALQHLTGSGVHVRNTLLGVTCAAMPTFCARVSRAHMLPGTVDDLGSIFAAERCRD